MKSVFIIWLISLKLACYANVKNDDSLPSGRQILLQLPFSEVFASKHNPSIFHNYSYPIIDFYLNQPVFLSSLYNCSVSSQIPIRKSQLGAEVSYYGFSLYSTKKVAVSYGRQLSEDLILASSIILNHTSIKKLSSLLHFSARIAAYYKLMDNLDWTFVIQFPFQKNINRDRLFPISLSFGNRYKFSTSVSLCTIISKTLHEKLRMEQDLSYAPNNSIVLRMMYSFFPFVSSAGVGFLYGKFKIDIDVRKHQHLGFSPGVSLAIILK
ncbi:MAG: hypothetical protein HKN92_01050 [Chitinophagales bacterium]|nr:hypothetical protein [Chitinophagales bacterium]